MEAISYREKICNLQKHFESVMARSPGKVHSEELTRLIIEPANAKIRKDLIPIWLRVFENLLSSDSTPLSVQEKLIETIFDKADWFNKDSPQIENLEALSDFIYTLQCKGSDYRRVIAHFLVRNIFHVCGKTNKPNDSSPKKDLQASDVSRKKQKRAIEESTMHDSQGFDNKKQISRRKGKIRVGEWEFNSLEEIETACGELVKNLENNFALQNENRFLEIKVF